MAAIIVSASRTQPPELTVRSITMLAVADNSASWMAFRWALQVWAVWATIMRDPALNPT